MIIRYMCILLIFVSCSGMTNTQNQCPINFSVTIGDGGFIDFESFTFIGDGMKPQQALKELMLDKYKLNDIQSIPYTTISNQYNQLLIQHKNDKKKEQSLHEAFGIITGLHSCTDSGKLNITFKNTIINAILNWSYNYNKKDFTGLSIDDALKKLELDSNKQNNYTGEDIENAYINVLVKTKNPAPSLHESIYVLCNTKYNCKNISFTDDKITIKRSDLKKVNKDPVLTFGEALISLI